MTVQIINADVMDGLRQLPDESVHCVVTSPPYWGLRSYLPADHPLKHLEIGRERTFQQHLEKLVNVFREVRRVLRSDGTCWLNYGDCYANDGKFGGESGGKHAYHNDENRKRIGREKRRSGLKPKDLCMLPNRLAIALQDDGWWVRSEIIWHKLNPMPESVTDRPTCSHEKLWFLTKSERYYYDAEAIMEPSSPDSHARAARGRSADHKWADGGPGNQTIAKGAPVAGRYFGVPGVTPKSAPENSDIKAKGSFHASTTELLAMRNKRNVWSLTSEGFPEAHYATFPPALVEPCIKAGCPAGGLVLDPFGGSGTVGLVADRLQRDATLIDLDPANEPMARRRIHGDRGELLDLMEAVA